MERPDLTVRRATAADARLLASLGARTFRDTFGKDNSEADMAAYLSASFAPEIQARELADVASTFLIAHAGDLVAGYARTRLGDAPDCVIGERPIEIVRFYADAPWIGRGIGATLMTACLELAAGLDADVIWLGVWERNPRAIAFYAKWGFAEAGRQTFVLGDDVQHDILMTRTIESHTP